MQAIFIDWIVAFGLNLKIQRKSDEKHHDNSKKIEALSMLNHGLEAIEQVADAHFIISRRYVSIILDFRESERTWKRKGSCLQEWGRIDGMNLYRIYYENWQQTC